MRRTSWAWSEGPVAQMGCGVTSGKEGVKEVAVHSLFQPISTGNATDEFIENQTISLSLLQSFPDFFFYFSCLFLLRFFHPWVPEAAEVSSPPRANFKQTVPQTEEAHGMPLLSVFL